jgi:cyclophilin family peptidyl-prolyl cis-trans isomerase
MHNLLFTTQESWVNMDSTEFSNFIWTDVSALGLDLEQFDEDVNSDKINEKIATNYDEAIQYATEPPVVLVNGTATPMYISTVRDFFVWLDTLMIPYGRHIKNNQFSECPPMTIDPEKEYTATLHTDVGDVVLALYPDVAPMAVNSFVFLAENDYYDNTPFYAVIEGFVAQAGDPSGTGWGTPGYLFGLETSPDLTFERPYMLAMANSGTDTNNSQFFITYSPLTYLDGKYTIFGEVLDGVDVLKSLSARDPEQNIMPPIKNYILDVTIEEK